MDTDRTPSLCAGCQCDLPCGPGICECPVDGCADCPRCQQRAETIRRAKRRVRLEPRPGHPTQLVMVPDEELAE